MTITGDDKKAALAAARRRHNASDCTDVELEATGTYSGFLQGILHERTRASQEYRKTIEELREEREKIKESLREHILNHKECTCEWDDWGCPYWDDSWDACLEKVAAPLEAKLASESKAAAHWMSEANTGDDKKAAEKYAAWEYSEDGSHDQGIAYLGFLAGVEYERTRPLPSAAERERPDPFKQLGQILD